MNWKKGFYRITILLSAVILCLGALLVGAKVSADYESYRQYSIKAQRPVDTTMTGSIRNTGTGEVITWVEAFKRERHQDSIYAASYKEIYRSFLVWGIAGTILGAAAPWALFGIGLYLVRGFRTP